jgi:hypothetical protein
MTACINKRLVSAAAATAAGAAAALCIAPGLAHPRPLFAQRTTAARRPAAAAPPMTRERATGLARAFLRSYGVESAGLNANGLGGAAVGDGSVYFEYRPGPGGRPGTLKCSALIYRFHDLPKPGVLDGFRAEERAGTADTGGGRVDYEPENKGLYLSRVYAHPVDAAAFRRDMERLMKASRVWGDEVLDRVATRVFQKGEAR